MAQSTGALSLFDSIRVAQGTTDLTAAGRYGATLSAVAGMGHWKELLLAVVLHLIVWSLGGTQGPSVIYSALSGAALAEGRILYAIAPVTVNGADAIQDQTVNGQSIPNAEQRNTTLANLAATGVGFFCAKCKIV